MSVMPDGSNKEGMFVKYIRERYKGKVHKMERVYDPALFNIVKVHVMFHIPVDEADELEIYRRINKVIRVIAEGDDE
jgi:hypothetical protein